MAIGEVRLIQLKHDVVDCHAFLLTLACIINLCLRKEVEGTRKVVLESTPSDLSLRRHKSQRSRLCCGFKVVENIPCASHIFRKGASVQKLTERHSIGANASRGHLQRRRLSSAM